MSRRGLVLFLTISLIWGLPYLLIKVAVTDLSPFVVVFGRVALAAAVLLPLAARRGMLRGLRPHLRWIAAFGALEITIPFVLIAFAETRLSSSLTGLAIAIVPTVAAIVARIIGLDDRLTGVRLLGLAVGFTGVAALVGLDVSSGDMIAVAALAVTAVGYAVAPMIIPTKLSGVPDLAIIALATAMNAVIYAPFAIATWPEGPVPAKAWWSLLALGLVCTAIAFVVFFALIAEIGPARTTVITYLNPVVALLLGVAILDEPFTAGIAIGFPLVLLGSYLATRRSPVRDLEDAPHP